MKKILSIILSITMFLSMGTAAFADGVDGPMQKTKIKVATSADFKPFEYYDENGELTGFDIDLMNYIGERIGFDIEFVNISFDKVIPAVISGEVNCAISAISQTNERREVVDFSRPYLRATITQNDGETKKQEVYSIVFKEGMSDTKFKSSFPTEEEKKYLLITGALDELISDGTVDKLIEKYNLNKELEEDAEYHYEYDTVKGSATPAAKTKDEEKQTTEICLAPPSEWAEDSVIKATDLKIMEPGKEYNFSKAITREEFCELIYNYCANVLEMLSTADGDRFADTDNPKIEILCAMGIINGKSTHEFAPDDALTREEAAVILQRMVNATVPVTVTEMWFEFDDIDYISDWAMDAVQTMCNMNVMNGVGNDRFAPKDTYTTEQAIVTLVRLYANSGVSKNVIGGADEPTEIVVTTAVTVKNISTGEEKTLSMDDSEAIFDIVREIKDWNDGTSDCLNDCEIKIGNKTIMYHSECGTFNDNERGVSISLGEKTAHHLASILSKYVPLVFECH